MLLSEIRGIKQNIESIKDRNQEITKEYDSLKTKVELLKSEYF